MININLSDCLGNVRKLRNALEGEEESKKTIQMLLLKGEGGLKIQFFALRSFRTYPYRFRKALQIKHEHKISNCLS